MKPVIMAAALLAAWGGRTSGGGDGGEGLAAVRPTQVTVEALRAAADPGSRAFYEGRDWRPAWTADDAAARSRIWGRDCAMPRATLSR